MRTHPLGADGPTISEVGFGCSRLGGVFGSGTSRRDEIRLVREALDAGITFFDTSDLYSHGQSETLLGSALAGRRDRAVIATKGGYVMPAQNRLLARAKPILRPVVRTLRVRRPAAASGPGGRIDQDFSPVHLRAAVEGSLRRLRTDRIDLYQLHSPPASVVESEDAIAALEQLRDEGKIVQLGVAADDPADVAGFDRHPSIGVLQVPFSAVEPVAGDELVPRAAAAGVGVIARSCFAAGLLVGDADADGLRSLTPDWEAILAFRSVAAELGRSRQELALQFDLGTPGITTTILGMKTSAHLRTLLRAVEAPPLTQRERELVAAVPRRPVR